MSSETAVRVNSETLRNHRHQRVRIVGTVLNRSSEQMTITSTDEMPILIYSTSNEDFSRGDFQTNSWVEVTGHVQDDNSILAEIAIPLQGNIDKEAWNQMALLIDKHNEIFFDRT